MSNRTTLAAVLAAFFTLIMACDDGKSLRESSNRKIKNSAITEDSGQAGDESDGEGTTETGSATGAATADETGTSDETTGAEPTGGDESSDLAYAADQTLYYSNFAKASFDTYCISCHPSNIPSLTTFESIKNNAEDVKTSLMNRSMPPAISTALPDEVRLKMVNWILAGAKKAPSALSFEKPNKLNTPVIGTSTEVRVLLANNKPDATWELFYTPTPDVTTGGTRVGAVQPMSGNGVVIFDVSAVTPGTYYLYAVLKDGVESAVAKAAGSLRIGLPSIILAAGWREGSKAFLSTADLTFAVQDEDNAKVYTVNLAVKKDSGSYQDIVVGSSDLTKYSLPGSYTFTDGLNYRFKASLLENGVEVHFDESLGPVGIGTAAMSYASLRTEFIDAECGTCHVPPSQSGSFRSDTYGTEEGAQAKAAEIVNRMNETDPSRWMPVAGILSLAQRDRVKLWYWLGADP